ncbi:hypothetical protein [Duncaniella muris]|uniref:hypothetical protein n=2 Tax=Duncaniella muris TaxID=2094150 RepID=UPI00271552C0|nr:hypothetical protein [Duncaniella muris]
MEKNGKLLNLNPDSPKYGNKSLVTREQENELKRRKITFSFSYFKQIPNFQVGACSKGWHIGLLERLGALGKMSPQEVLEENKGSEALRCHPIDWGAKNIPIQRKDLEWLPKEILDNEAEFPIMQFSITKGTGRIVGYFDRDSSIFHIVLLDPEHNIQPSKKTNYQIQPTTKGLSQYDELLNKLERIKKIISDCSDKECKLHSHISAIEELHDNIVYLGLDNDFYTTYQDILKRIPLQEIMEKGILASMDNV